MSYKIICLKCTGDFKHPSFCVKLSYTPEGPYSVIIQDIYPGKCEGLLICFPPPCCIKTICFDACVDDVIQKLPFLSSFFSMT